jgi:lantibiotic modifying enzyme
MLTQGPAATDRYGQLSLASAEHMRENFLPDSHSGNCGGFNGLSGMIYFWSHLAYLEQDDRYTKLATDCLKKFGHDLPNNEILDIINGLAGTILSLISLSKVEFNELVMQIAIQWGANSYGSRCFAIQ